MGFDSSDVSRHVGPGYQPSPAFARRLRVNGILDKFRARGGRVTEARRAIVTTLLSTDGHEHLSADDVAQRVQVSHPDIAVSTVYRSLDALQELGVVEHVHVGHGPTVFHLVDHAHVHLLCHGCNEIIELSPDSMDAMRREVEERHGFVIDPSHFAIGGRCASCVAAG